MMIISAHEYDTNNPMQFYSVLSLQFPFTTVSGPMPKFD